MSPSRQRQSHAHAVRFQSERRTTWEAPDVYMGMSPFMVAQKINEPILFTHGEADNNQGTFPIQSESHVSGGARQWRYGAAGAAAA